MKAILYILSGLISLNCFSQQINQAKLHFGNDPKQGKYFQNRGFKMYYEVYGKGEPLLIIHGNGGSISNFEKQIPYFATKYKVILADSRAHGKSIDLADSLSYEQLADDLNGLLDHLKIDSCNVIGWSDGGVEGLLLAIRHPEKVKKLAVTGANLIPDPIISTDPWVVTTVLHEIDSIQQLPISNETKGALKLRNLLIHEPHITHADLQKIACPTLVIGGDQDVIVPRHTLEIAENIQKANLWILPNSGHATPIIYSDLFNKTVQTFFVTPYLKKERAAKFN